MSIRARWLAMVVVAAWAGNAAGEEPPSAEAIAFFERDIRPILVRRCYECHSAQAKTLQGGLRLDTRSGVMKGGDSGPAVVPGQTEASLLVEAVRFGDEFQMPPDGKLPASEIALLTEWVRRGAPYPADTAPVFTQPSIDWNEARQFWSFQPVHESPLPVVSDPAWVQRRIDAFIRAKLDEQQLAPSPPADRRTLLRRATFDLIGLPPTPEETEAFLTDDSPDAYARLIDRLLASPHYGERWGRYWLDLARYTDQTAEWLQSTAHAWLYRDWVVQALNEDRPYDEFVKLQLAADRIEGTDPEDLAALGFVGLSPTYWKELKLAPDVIKTVVAEEWEERIDAVSRTFLGLTVACARCHDHKFDPITTQDYYALAGVFASTRLVDRFLLPEEEAQRVQAAHEQVGTLEKQIAALEKVKDKPEETPAKIAELRRRVAEIKTTTPNYDAMQACAVDEASVFVLPDGADATKIEYKPDAPLDLHVQVRGDPARLGPLTPRRFLQVLTSDPPPQFRDGSGRRELAESIVGDAAALSARVMVNRVWRHHFGRGLVDTPSDFGAQGARPTHPELLDDLAARFIQSGWSLKWLHRELMLSSTYQQSSAIAEFESSNPQSTIPSPQSLDPENRLLGRMNRQRLDFEPWRDAMLAAAGELDLRLGGQAAELKDLGHRRRTLYGRIHRHELEVMLRLYDFPDPSSHSPSRDATTTPLQGLFVLNGPFVQRQAAALAARLEQEHPNDPAARIVRAYELLFARTPRESETQLAREFLGAKDMRDQKMWRLYLQALLGSNEFLFVD